MEKWLSISLLLCSFGFFREMRPNEPFITEYLTGDRFNITVEEVKRELYPFGTYSVLAQSVIFFLITDIFRYKPIIILSACTAIIVFAILLWTKTLLSLQIGQIFDGTFVACEVAYYTYIYAKVEKEHYQMVTAQTRSAILCGRFLGSVLAQILISSNAIGYRGLHFISFGTQIISLFIAIALPSVKRSLYFHNDADRLSLNDGIVMESAKATKTTVRQRNDLSNGGGDVDVQPHFSWRRATKLLWQHTITAYSNQIVVEWSIWWALATCGQIQVMSYVQFLWKIIDPSHENFYNGAVEAMVTLLGVVAAMGAGMIDSQRYKKWHMCILTICSLLMGGFLIISATTDSIWIAYSMYILFGIFFNFIITIASATVAENLSDDSFGLIFGINSTITMLLRTILILVVVTDIGYSLESRQQYIVYGEYFLSLAALYCIACCWNCFSKKNGKYFLNKRKNDKNNTRT